MQTKVLLSLLAIGMATSFGSVEAQTSELFDFDDGTVMGFSSITRPDTYNDEPTAVTSDVDFPGAFPPPSGTFALRVADDDENSFGLASAVGGFQVNRTDPDFGNAIFEAKIYVVESNSTTEGNVALIVINDGTPSENEAYYRFGYRNGEVYLQKFDAVGFSTLGQDSAIVAADELTIPGWNTFRMEFVGADQINLSVNDVEVDFSPVVDTEPAIDEAMQIGVLGFNITSFSPILADDLYQELNPSTVKDWSLF